MILKNKLKKGAYFDSVTLMLLSEKMKIEGVKEAAAMMGSAHNIDLMINSGILTRELAIEITGNDLIIGVLASDDNVAAKSIEEFEKAILEKDESSSNDDKIIRNVDDAIKYNPNLNFSVISIPGRFAKYEAMNCLEKNINVLLFSDNVRLEDEKELKDYAIEKGLFMMGPDCGTSIINGVALGFSNVVNRGNIGLIAASGTGLQEVSVIIDLLGGGISQAIGVGGRDLNKNIGASMTLFALEALKNDPLTQIIGIISKPADKSVFDDILKKIENIGKPVVLCILGLDERKSCNNAIYVETLEEAAIKLVSISEKRNDLEKNYFSDKNQNESTISDILNYLGEEQKYLRGLYCGGTLAYESLLLSKNEIEVYSNLNRENFLLENVLESIDNTIIDMGDDYFTDGMAHPMIDPRQRSERILKEYADDSVAVILLDCVIGFGANEDPAKEIVKTIERAKELYPNKYKTIVASVCGTQKDLQVRKIQEQQLLDSGIHIMSTNAQAAKFAIKIIKSKEAMK